MPFVFVLFPLYGVKKEGKVITCEGKKELFFGLFFRNSGLACARKTLDGWRLTGRARRRKLPLGTLAKL